MKEFFCKYCGQVYESTDPNPAACPLCAACMDDAAAAIAEDAAAGGDFFVIDETDAIYKQGSYAECKAFLHDASTREIAEAAGGLDLSIVSFGEWMQRNVYDGSGDRFTDPTEDASTEPGQAPEWNGVHFTDGVQMPTREEMRDFWQHEHELRAWMQSLTPEQIDKLCNAGYYNDAIKGYLIAAAKEAGMDHDQQQALLNALRYCLDTLTKSDAERVYLQWHMD